MYACSYHFIVRLLQRKKAPLFMLRDHHPAQPAAPKSRPRAAVVDQQAEPFRESAARAPWPWAHSARVTCRRVKGCGRRCWPWCRGECWSSTPRTWCLGGQCRRISPAGARALVACGACRPMFFDAMMLVGKNFEEGRVSRSNAPFLRVVWHLVVEIKGYTGRHSAGLALEARCDSDDVA